MKFESNLQTGAVLLGILSAFHAACGETPEAGAPVAIVAVSAKPPATKPLLSRWLELDNFSHSERYRNAFNVGGDHNFEGAQQRSLLKGDFKLDAQGRYAIGFRASSGRYFNWAYGNYTGLSYLARATSPANSAFLTPAEAREAKYAAVLDPGALKLKINSNGWEFYMRELYLQASPVKPITLDFGSFGFDRGLSTEITSFDEDGYLSGERIHLHDPKHLFFDEIGFTNAYFGALATVNLFARGTGSLTTSNYRQIQAVKRVYPKLGLSADYTWQLGTDTLREAALLKTDRVKAVDGVRLEVYERLNTSTFAGAAHSAIGPIPSIAVKGASGFAVTAEKKLGRWSGDAGFATVDSDYAVYAGSRFFHAVGYTLNGDTYGLGNRPFVHASYSFLPGVTGFGFYTHEVGSTRVLTHNQQGLNAGVTFDFKELVNKEKLVF